MRRRTIDDRKEMPLVKDTLRRVLAAASCVLLAAGAFALTGCDKKEESAGTSETAESVSAQAQTEPLTQMTQATKLELPPIPLTRATAVQNAVDETKNTTQTTANGPAAEPGTSAPASTTKPSVPSAKPSANATTKPAATTTTTKPSATKPAGTTTTRPVPGTTTKPAPGTTTTRSAPGTTTTKPSGSGNVSTSGPTTSTTAANGTGTTTGQPTLPSVGSDEEVLIEDFWG